MKVSPITQTNTKPITSKGKISRFFTKNIRAVKELCEDVFEAIHDIPLRKKYVYYGGKKVRLVDVPNYAGMPDGVVDKGVTFGKVKFYKEDLDILSKMENVRERINYKRKLIEAGKYYD